MSYSFSVDLEPGGLDIGAAVLAAAPESLSDDERRMVVAAGEALRQLPSVFVQRLADDESGEVVENRPTVRASISGHGTSSLSISVTLAT